MSKLCVVPDLLKALLDLLITPWHLTSYWSYLHKQGHSSRNDILSLKLDIYKSQTKKSKVRSVGVTLTKRPNRENDASFRSQFSYQSATLLIKFHAGGKFFFPSII